MEQSSKIKLIIAFPKSKTRYAYYLNNNLNDKHTMDRDEFYFFVASLLQPPNTVKVRQFIDRNRYFLIDFENQEVHELKQSEEDKKQKKDQARQIKTEKIFKKWKKQRKEAEQNTENSIYEKDVEEVTKKALDKNSQNRYSDSEN